MDAKRVKRLMRNLGKEDEEEEEWRSGERGNEKLNKRTLIRELGKEIEDKGEVMQWEGTRIRELGKERKGNIQKGKGLRREDVRKKEHI